MYAKIISKSIINKMFKYDHILKESDDNKRDDKIIHDSISLLK